MIHDTLHSLIFLSNLSLKSCNEMKQENDIVNLEELASGTSLEFMSRGFHSGDSQRMDESLIESLIGFQDDLTDLG